MKEKKNVIAHQQLVQQKLETPCEEIERKKRKKIRQHLFSQNDCCE